MTPIVIPALNPDEKLITLLGQLEPDADLRPVILVNDGSSEQSVSIWQRAEALEGVTVISHSLNRGKGAALKTAMEYCLHHLPAITGIITCDCDGQHRVTDINALIKRLSQTPDSLLLGSRRFSLEGIPLRSRLGNWVSRFSFRMAGVYVSDTQTGLRAIPVGMFPELLAITYDRFEFETAMLITAARGGIPILEQPIETVYLDGNRSSHFSPMRDSARIYKVLLRGTLRQVRRFIVSSATSAALDLLLFALLFHWLLPHTKLPLLVSSIVIARICSGVYNYLLNHNWVFGYPGCWNPRTALRYLSLALIIAGASYLLMRQLLPLVPTRHATPLKAGIDIFLFIASFLAQKLIVFHRTKALNSH